MKGQINWRWIVIGAAALLATASPGRASWIETELPYPSFGHLVNWENRCSSSSTINAFGYLEKTYPSIFGNRLTKGNPEASRNQLAAGWNGHTGMGNPASVQSMWENKVRWVNDYAPGTLNLQGMAVSASTSWVGGSGIKQGLPTFDFMLKGLRASGEVEFCFFPIANGMGHVMTLTGLRFNDADNDGKYDAGEQAQITYLDNCDPSHLTTRMLISGSDGSLRFNYNSANADPNVFVGLAFTSTIIGASATPPSATTTGTTGAGASIPEPAALSLLAISGLCFLRRRAA